MYSFAFDRLYVGDVIHSQNLTIFEAILSFEVEKRLSSADQ